LISQLTQISSTSGVSQFIDNCSFAFGIKLQI
jgi:hypothetical protein